jgi:[CysO sulfur-carrier protein]-S-L-cysteine hydrolase
MPATTILTLTSNQRDIMIAHALQEAPNECCGLLLGRCGTIERVVAMTSDRPGPDAYYMNPEQQIGVFTGMEERGEELLGIYHSHPKGSAQPSSADLQLAFHPEAAYIIISLEDTVAPELRAFRIHGGTYEEIVLQQTA